MYLFKSCVCFRLVCETTEGCIIGGTGLGKRGIKAQAVGSSAAKDIVDTVSLSACVDSYTQVMINVDFK